MCSEVKLLLVLTVFLAVSCTSARVMQRIRSGEVRMDISVPDEKPIDDGTDREVKIDSIRSDL